MMKYLAFGLMAALLLDATVIRMFLVPSVMKLLGDDCWWAPRWMKRLQNRIGLGEIRLPDERKRSVPRRATPAPAGATPASFAAPRPVHDPTHPAPGAQARSRTAEQLPTRPVTGNPSGARTNRLNTGPPDAPTARFSAADAVTERVESPGKDPAAPDREIESWLGELRGGRDAASRPRDRQDTPEDTGPQPSDERTQALQVPPKNAQNSQDGGDAENAATTAIPAQGPQRNTASNPSKPSKPADPDNPATEKFTAPGEQPGDNPQRRGAAGGLSAAELLRREGRY